MLPFFNFIYMSNNKILKKFDQLSKNKEAGRWILKVRGNKDRFTLTNIDAFIDPELGGSKKVLFKNDDNTEIETLFLFKMETIFDCDSDRGIRSIIDTHNVSALIRHPKVKLEDLTDDEYRVLVQEGKKVSNPEFSLKSLSWEEESEFNDSLKMLGLRSWLLSDENPLSLKVVIYLINLLKLPYEAEQRKYSDKKDVFRKSLLRKIDKNLSRNKNGEFDLIQKAKNDMNYLEDTFFINKFKEIGIVTFESNLYNIGGYPVGPNDDSLINYYRTNIELYQKHKEKYLSQLKNKVEMDSLK